MSPDRKHQPGHRHSHVERRWSVDDALREYAKLIRWYDSADEVREAYNTYRLHYGGVWPASLADEHARQRVAERTTQATAASMRSFDPVWCDPPMVDLLAAAADTYPAEPMRPEHLLALDGMVIFAKPLPVVWHGDGEDEEHHLTAISWGESLSTNDGRPFTSITAWHRYTGLRREGSGLSIRYVGLRPQSHSMGAPWIEPTDVGGPASPHRLLQAFRRWRVRRWCVTSTGRCRRRPAGKARELVRGATGVPTLPRVRPEGVGGCPRGPRGPPGAGTLGSGALEAAVESEC